MRLRSTVNVLGSSLMNRGAHRQSKMGGGMLQDRKSSKSFPLTRRIIRDPKTECKMSIFGEARPPQGDDFQCRMTRLLFEATDKLSVSKLSFHHFRNELLNGMWLLNVLNLHAILNCKYID
jgi:hypothetical protein